MRATEEAARHLGQPAHLRRGDCVCGTPSTGLRAAGAGEGSDRWPGSQRGRQCHLSLARTGRSRLHATQCCHAVRPSVRPRWEPPAWEPAAALPWPTRHSPTFFASQQRGHAKENCAFSHLSFRVTEKEIPVSQEDGLGTPTGDLVTADG